MKQTIVPRTLVRYGLDKELGCIVNLKFGRAELGDRRRARRPLRRIAGVTRPVAGTPRKTYAPAPVPGGTMGLVVEANTLADRELLLERKSKTTF